MIEGESAFWKFSLRFYSLPDVAPACIALQDECGIDVNILFYLIFLASHLRRINAEDIGRLDDAVKQWRNEVVRPLRTLRRKLKSDVAPFHAQSTESLRTEVKRCELAAERLQQEMLERIFPPGEIGKDCAPPEACKANIAAYAEIICAFPPNYTRVLLDAFEREVSGNT